MRNQPKYNFYKNTTYALNGFKDMLKNETSFKIELILFVILTTTIFFLKIPFVEKLILFIPLNLVLISEAANSAIERVVDLVTSEQHPLAGQAKDIGSTIVFLSLFLVIVIWSIIIIKNYII